MRKAVVALAAAVVAGGLATFAPGQAVPPGGLPATTHTLAGAQTTRHYPTYDASGRRGRVATWRVTGSVGNCCEVFVAATPRGTLLEFGGTYPMVSEDRGAFWQEVSPTPDVLMNGEGAISAAPGGDVVGVGWDAYTGDHLQAFKYDGEARTWSYAEVPLREPLFDRPWIAVLPGRFALPGGGTSDYATVVRANYLSGTKETFLVSLDGLTYLPTTSLGALRGGVAGPSSGYLDVPPNPALDYGQPHHESRMTPLSDGRLLTLPSPASTSCPSAIWSQSGLWTCWGIQDRAFSENLVVDSRGWLHELAREDDGLTYRLSANGGRTWRETRLEVPLRDGVITGATNLDHKANGALGVAAVAAHVRVGDKGQDLVFRVDVKRSTPRLVETMLVGRGDTAPGQGAAEVGDRYDFVSVAILPDGTFAMSFHDSTSGDPLLAVEVPDPRRRR